MYAICDLIDKENCKKVFYFSKKVIFNRFQFSKTIFVIQ